MNENMNIEEPIELIQIKRKTFDRIVNHSRYYCENSFSFDEIIIRLLDFYEESLMDIEDFR